ncbi:MAG: PAS domain-containing protein [Verrucomicrobia bacterium]|nr:PAS domain-containing protein [Verrucomicrobiota bacterium]
MPNETPHLVQEVAAALPEALWLRDAVTGGFVYCSPGADQIWQRSSGALMQQPGLWLEAIWQEDRERVAAAWKRCARGSGFDQHYRVRHGDGTMKWVHDRGFPMRREPGADPQLAGLARDVTERKRLEAEVVRREDEIRQQHRHLVRLTERMVDLEERERRRISSLIHDTVVQSLSLSNIRLGAVRKALDQPGLEQERTQLEAARELIAEGIAQCRLVMADLTPPLLYEVGLGAALKQFSQRIQRLQGIRVTVEDTAKDPEVPESLRGLLFQAARELVMNACKHAAPSEIRIRLFQTDHAVELRVCDDGSGFDPDLIEQRRRDAAGGFGLFSVRQRLDRHGGTLVVNSSPGTGSELCVRLPVPLPEASNRG